MSGNVVLETGDIVAPVIKFPIADLVNVTSSQQGLKNKTIKTTRNFF